MTTEQNKIMGALKTAIDIEKDGKERQSNSSPEKR